VSGHLGSRLLDNSLEILEFAAVHDTMGIMTEPTGDTAGTTTVQRADHATRLKSGPANPASRSSRMIRKAELDQLREERDALQTRLDAIETAKGDLDAQGGILNAARMRKVIGQRPEADCGPLERTLREWLQKSPKDFIGAMEERERGERGVAAMEAENARLRDEVKALNEKYAPPTGRDEGSERARAVLDRLLADFSETQKETCPKCNHTFTPKG
jgi:cell division protein FtsB